MTLTTKGNKCHYCGLLFNRHNIQELKYCFDYMIKKLNSWEGYAK